jgi:LCP family protein required for cell wall assembly
MTDGRRPPDRRHPGTVYRSRPRLWPRRDGSAGRLPGLRASRTPVGSDVPDPVPGNPSVGHPPTGYDPAGHPPTGYGSSTEHGAPTGYGPSTGYGPTGHGATGHGASGSPPRRFGPTGFGPTGPRPGRPRIRARRVALVVALLLVLYPLALFWVAWSHLGKVTAMPGGTRPNPTPGRTYLVVGSDSRSALTPAERRRLGTGRAVGNRTDTIMLLHVPSGGGPTVLVSVPRDSYVSIPGHGKNKINSAYAFGGPQLLVRTVENATGVRVDEYVETGLLGYADLVDAVGGVTVCVKKPINDTKAHINLKAGCQGFDGRTALGFARARYSDPRGDLGRVERQRQVLAAIAGKTLSPSVVLLPWRAFPAASAGGNALAVDDGTSPWGLVSFVLAMRDVAGGGGLSLTVPVSNPDLRTSVGSAVQWDRTRAKALFEDLRRDDTEAIRSIAESQKRTSSR